MMIDQIRATIQRIYIFPKTPPDKEGISEERQTYDQHPTTKETA